MGCGSSTSKVFEPNKSSFIDEAVNGNPNGLIVTRRVEAEVDHIELTESVLEHYIRLEKEIHRLEKKNVTKKYEDKVRHADDLKKNVDQLEATFKELKKQTEKGKADVANIEQPSVRAFLRQQGTYEQKFNKEHQAYLDSLNKQEIAEKELHGSKMQHERAAKIAEFYKKRSDKLNDFYDQQDRLLAGIFGGQYGSDLEYRLETQLDEALEWQQRVALAKFKWTNGRVLLVHACAQIAFGIKRWKELGDIEVNNTRMRYFSAAEARNNFLAAGQNVQSCRVYLGKVRFPYCTEEQMEQMEKSVNNAFSDIQSQERYNRSSTIYESMHRQVAALIQWFDQQVLNETILPDLEEANNEVSRNQQELRMERLKLIRAKVKERLGHDIEIDYSDVEADGTDDDKELMALEAERVPDADDLPGEKLSRAPTAIPLDDGRLWTPLAPDKLAPAPSNDALFGNIEELKRQHEEERLSLLRQREVARARMDQGLQEKLQQRRTTKDRRKSTVNGEISLPTLD